MTTITVRNVPPEVRNELAARAAREGRSLQEYLLRELSEFANKPSAAYLVEEVRRRKMRDPRVIGGEQILADRDAERR